MINYKDYEPETTSRKKEDYVFSKKIPLINEYDVIVAGGGPAGCGCAIAAAREGARVLLLERTGMLGGAATAGLVDAWAPFTDGINVLYNGIAKDILARMKARMPIVDPTQMDWVPIDPEVLKKIYDEQMAHWGVTVLFQSSVCSVQMLDEEIIDCVLVSNKGGLTAYRAKVYVDCTGDGDLCYWAGAHCWKGEEGDLQAATLCFSFSNVNKQSYGDLRLHPSDLRSPIHKIVLDEEFSIKDKHCCEGWIGTGTMSLNAGHIWNVDGTDPISVSDAFARGRQIAMEYEKALKKYLPDVFKDARLAQTASSLGVRETRRVEGDYVFTVKDYFARRHFEDEICCNCYCIDVHGVFECADQMDEGWDPDGKYEHYKPGENHGVPYRCLTPKGIRNLLMAGRCISSDRLCNGSLRVMPVCVSTGEAAGIAAAIAIGSPKIDVHSVDVSLIRKKLKEAGAYLP